jgi:hypothetical protein
MGLSALMLMVGMVKGDDFTYTNADGAVLRYVTGADNTIKFTGYTGSGGVVTISSTINGLRVTSIDSTPFAHCTSLTSVVIPASITNIVWPFECIFMDCTNLSAITVDASNSVYSSLDGVLFNKSQTELIFCPFGKAGSCTIPNTVTNIEQGAFARCTRLTSVTIPASVKNMNNDFGFGFGDSLTAITVDASNPVYSSLDGVLFDKSQTTLIEYPLGKAGSYTIPNSVTNIGIEAFSGCGSLIAIRVGVSNSVYSSLNGVLFNKSLTTLIQCPGGKVGSYLVPNSVTNIGNEAFQKCTKLTSVTIPDSVASIEDGAFFECSTRLTAIYFKGNAPSLGASAFINDTNATVYYLPGTTGWSTTFGGRPAKVWKP